MPIQFYSHPATRQDEWLIETMGKSALARGGFFVDIGAHDGLRYSNSLMLERHFGWDGLLVEANPQLYVDCKKNRLNQCVQTCVADKIAHERNFVVGDAYSGLTEFMPAAWLVGHNARNNPHIRVSTMTLSRLLSIHTRESRPVDFLSLDVEGAELPILKTWMQGGHTKQVNYLSVEFRYDHALLMELERLLEPAFRLDQVRGFDACFVNRTIGEKRVPRSSAA